MALTVPRAGSPCSYRTVEEATRARRWLHAPKLQLLGAPSSGLGVEEMEIVYVDVGFARVNERGGDGEESAVAVGAQGWMNLVFYCGRRGCRRPTWESANKCLGRPMFPPSGRHGIL